MVQVHDKIAEGPKSIVQRDREYKGELGDSNTSPMTGGTTKQMSDLMGFVAQATAQSKEVARLNAGELTTVQYMWERYLSRGWGMKIRLPYIWQPAPRYMAAKYPSCPYAQKGNMCIDLYVHTAIAHKELQTEEDGYIEYQVQICHHGLKSE